MARTEIKVTVQVETPLLLAARKEGTVAESLSYLPAAALRGALAKVILDRIAPGQTRHTTCSGGQVNACDFCRIFHAAVPPRFSNAYPGDTDAVRPLPLSAYTCKAHPGFRSADARHNHGVWDTLFVQAISDSVERIAGLVRPFGLPVYDPQCALAQDAMAEPWSGHFYAPYAQGYLAPRALRRRFSRTAISRRLGTAQPQLLYTLEVISERMDADRLDRNGEKVIPQTVFHGGVVVHDAQLVFEVTRALRSITYLGSGYSRGLGRVHVDATPQVPAPTFGTQRIEPFLHELAAPGAPSALPANADLVERLIAFNRQLRATWASYGADLPPWQGWAFSVDLLADAILSNGFGPTLTLSPATLGAAFKPAVLWRAFAGRRWAGGWAASLGLPKDVAQVVAMGSTYLYYVSDCHPDAVCSLLLALERLEQEGIGSGREAGYGQVLVCSPFHVEVKPR